MVCCPSSDEKYDHLPQTIARTTCERLIGQDAYLYHQHKFVPTFLNHLHSDENLDSKRGLSCNTEFKIKEIGHIYSVVLGYKSSTSNDLIWDCEGVILSTTTVLTTATCLEFFKFVKKN